MYWWVLQEYQLHLSSSVLLLLVSHGIWKSVYSVPTGKFDVILLILQSLLVMGLLRRIISLDSKSKHDTLTGLLGRSYFMERLKARTSHPDDRIVLLLIDLDRFKYVNDTLGHQAGDVLLTEVAQKFRTILRETDTIARLGGDEFAVILDGSTLAQSSETGSLSDAIDTICNRLNSAFEGQLRISNYEVEVGLSTGVSIFPDHASDIHELLRCSAVAMYVAKRTKCGHFIYTPHSDTHSLESLVLVGSVRAALENNQFFLVYQPQKCLITNKVRAVEALLRWSHPTLGLLGPDKFIPICEHLGIMKNITEWVVSRALAQSSQWKREGIELEIAINISATDLLNPDFLAFIVRAMNQSELPASAITLEITETAVVSDIDTAIAVTEALDALGIRLSIDDYGTGHTSLSYLKHLPVRQIKIDKSFVTNILTSSDDYHIVQSTIALAHEMGYEVVAEGVECQDVHDLLVEMRCDLIQGYYLARPIPASRLTTAFIERIESLT